MKKFLKVLTLAVVLSLIVCAVVISTSAAENGRESELDEPWQYTNSSGAVKTAATISDAVSGAAAGSTVKLLCDQTIAHDDIIVKIGKKLTVDLNGKTLNISQTYQAPIVISSSNPVVFKNGTIVASGNSAFGKEGAGYAIFRNTVSGIKLTLDNVNTYSACVLLSGWNDAPTLTVNGGEHYLVYTPGHMFGGGIIEARLAATANINDAIIYVSNGSGVVNAHSFNATAEADKSVNYTFTNCKILTENGSDSVVGYANENTTITFDGCDIYGSIDTIISTSDVQKGFGYIKDGGIIFGGGTRWGGTSATLCSQVACKSGEAVMSIEDHESHLINLNSGSLYYDTTAGSLADISFSIQTGTAYTARYSAFYGAENGYVFSYDAIGKTHYTNDFGAALAYAESKVKMHTSHVIDLADENLDISRDIVIDLGGNTLKICESGDCAITLGAETSLTVENGKILKYDESGLPTANPLFAADGENVSLSLSGVTVDASSLIAVYSEGCNVKINGGVHGNYVADASVVCAYIDAYAQANVEIDDAVILVGTLPAFSSLAYDVEITLNGTTVLGDTAAANLMYFIDGNNKLTLNDCDVFASFGMICNTSADELRGAIVLGEGTRFSKIDAESGMICATLGNAFVVGKITDTVEYTASNGTSVSKSCTFEYTVASPSENDVATYVSSNLTLFTDDIKSAFALAESGSEVVLVKDITLTESEKAFITINTENLTFNLGGHIFEVIQEGEASIDINKDFKIKNGTIRAAMNDTVSAELRGRSYPVLRYGISKTGVDLVLENVNTYAGSLVFAWNCSGHSLTVIGGRHHAQTRGTGNDNGWLDVRGDFKFLASGAAFYINDSTNVVSSLSFKDTDTSVLDASFDFVGCNIISENGKSNVIGHANENSRFSFTDCDIYASINPSLSSNDSATGYSAIKAGAIVLGKNVRLSSVGTFISGGVIVAADGCVLTDTKTTGRAVYEGYSFIPETAHFAVEDRIVNATYSGGADSAENLTVTVKWYKEDGVTLVREDKVTKGTVLTPPTYTAGVSNGWFKTGYSGWSTAFASAVEATDFTAVSNISYYPCISSSVTADLTVARYNLTLVGKVCNNLYLPATASGVSIRGVYVGGVEIPKAKVMIDGVKYYMYTVSEVGAARLNTVTAVTVKYMAAGTELTATLSLRPSDYAKVLLADATLAAPVYSDLAHTVAADLVRYSNALCLVIDGKTDEILDSLVKTYGDHASDITSSNSFAEYRANTTPLKGVISSIALEVSATEPRWVFNVASDISVDSIEVELQGYLPTVKDGVNFGTIVYKAERKDDTGAFFTEYIPIYNLDRLMTVRVTLTNGSCLEGKYSLNAYYNGFVTDSGNDAEIKEFIKAFRSLGMSSSEYKYGTEIKTADAAYDFFKCDHANVGSYYTGRGRYCPDCATYIFFYSDYGAVADGKSDRNFNTSGTNNHEMMYKCHQDANAWKTRGYKTAVQAVGGAHNGTTYYIGQQYLVKSVSIMTDTSWAGAEFIVDDRTVHVGANDGFNTPVFTADVTASEWNVNYTAYAPSAGIASGSKNVGFAPGRPMMLRLVDNSRRNNIRQGANENEGASISEMILVDEYGNVSSETPIEWDYYNVSFCKYGCAQVDANSDKKCDICGWSIGKSMNIYGYATDVDPITVSGLDKDGNISFVWETITDSTVDIEHYTQCGRRFRVQRSNVTVHGIDHIFTEDDTSTTPRTAYAGIVNVNLCNNVTVSDMIVTQHISHAAKDGVGMGSYEFSGGNACNVNLLRYRTRNFFSEDGKVYSRGLFGTNYIRNFHVKDCVLTSFDSHSGAYNAILEDCTFEHVNFVGGGNAYMKNVTIYTDAGDSACVLRQDYGSMWHGNIYIDGLELRYSDTTNVCIDLVEASYTNWNFGTDTYLPTEIIANNVTIQRYTRSTDEYTVENGKIVENIVGINEIPLGIHYNINKQMASHVDYSTVNAGNLDAKHVTERVEINNSGNIKLLYPNHTYFANMEVYVDGVKQDWFVKRASLQCEDKDGDYDCDICAYVLNCSKNHPQSGDSLVECDGCGTVRFANSDESLPTLEAAYEYVSGGVTYNAYAGTPLTDIIPNADAGSTIKMLTDNTLELTGSYNINKNITFDLGGKTLTIYSPADVAAFNVGANKTVTFEGGTVICIVKSTEYTYGRPLVLLAGGSTVNYNNVTAFVSCLAFSYNGNGTYVNINGGEYYAIAQSSAGQAAFFEMRANVTLVANNALFYLTNLATNKSYYLISISSNYESSGTKKSTLAFTNCDIIRNDKGNLINSANEFTKITVDNCRVYGKLNNGSLYSGDSAQETAASKSGLFVVGNGTKLLGSSYVGTNVTYATGCSNSSSYSSVTYTVKKISGTGDSISIATQTKYYTYTNVVS